MKGLRVIAVDPSALGPGDYGWHMGRFYVRPPDSAPHCVAEINPHLVKEHADNSISVRALIDIYYNFRREWHGYLERGVWRLA